MGHTTEVVNQTPCC